MDKHNAPRVRDAARSRADILAAAEACFADKGFYGTSMNDIASLACINKRMLYAYFDSKENLYKQVLFTVYQHGGCGGRTAQERPARGIDCFIIAAYFDFLSKKPHICVHHHARKPSHAGF